VNAQDVREKNYNVFQHSGYLCVSLNVIRYTGLNIAVAVDPLVFLVNLLTSL